MSKTSRSRKRGVRLADLHLRVMAEYSSSGIWQIGRVGCFRHGMIEHSSLKLMYENLTISEVFRSELIDGIDLLAIDLGLDKTSRTITESDDDIFPFM